MTSQDKARDNKIRLIALRGGKCADCGGSFHPCCFHFDHRNPNNKTFSISDKLHWNIELLKEELDKCDMVCANCHALRTFVHRRERISEKQSAAQVGKKRSAEVRARMSMAQKGRHYSQETIKKMSESAKHRGDSSHHVVRKLLDKWPSYSRVN